MRNLNWHFICKPAVKIEWQYIREPGDWWVDTIMIREIQKKKYFRWHTMDTQFLTSKILYVDSQISIVLIYKIRLWKSGTERPAEQFRFQESQNQGDSNNSSRYVTLPIESPCGMHKLKGQRTLVHHQIERFKGHPRKSSVLNYSRYGIWDIICSKICTEEI